jgi:hypothetical protein
MLQVRRGADTLAAAAAAALLTPRPRTAALPPSRLPTPHRSAAVEDAGASTGNFDTREQIHFLSSLKKSAAAPDGTAAPFLIASSLPRAGAPQLDPAIARPPM